MSVFGTIIDGSQVEDAVQTFIKRWLPTYLSELADQRGLPRDTWLFTDSNGDWAAIRSWTNTPQFTLDENTQLPAALVITTGLAGRPVKEGDGSYRATWITGIAVVVSAKDQDSTQRLAKRFGAAIRWLFVQHPSLEDPNVEGTSWEDENYDDVSSEQERTLASVRMVFSIEYHHVVNALDGPVLPADPPADPTVPYTDWTTVGDPDDPAHPYSPVTVTRET